MLEQCVCVPVKKELHGHNNWCDLPQGESAVTDSTISKSTQRKGSTVEIKLEMYIL